MHVFPINYFEFSLFVILTFLTIDISLSLQIMTPSRRDQTFLKNVKKMRIILNHSGILSPKSYGGFLK